MTFSKDAMADTRSPEQRRRIMQPVKTRDTGPELTVRRLLYRLGYRYRLNAKNLPGRPDIVFPGEIDAPDPARGRPLRRGGRPGHVLLARRCRGVGWPRPAHLR